MGRPRVLLPVMQAEAPDDQVSELLTLQQVCDRLRTHNRVVYNLVKRGLLHPVRLPGGRRVFYAAWEVEAAAVSVCYPARAA